MRWALAAFLGLAGWSLPASAVAALPPGCASAVTVCAIGCDQTTIQNAVGVATASLSGNTCVEITDGGTYNEKVTVGGVTPGASDRLIIMGYPNPVVIAPSVPGHAAFQIDMDSVTLTNLGKAPLTRLQVLTRSDDPVLDGHEQLVGRLEPGPQRTVPLSVRVSARHGNVAVPMRVMAAQDGRALAQHDDTLVTVVERPQPDFAFRVAVDDAGSDTPDGVLQPNEAATLAVEVQNLGLGLSQATEVRLRVLGAQRLHLAEGRVRLGLVPESR